MDITCDKCQSEFKIPDNKIPEGKTASFLCRKCKSKITISAPMPSDDLGFDLSNDDESSFANSEEENDGFDIAEQLFSDTAQERAAVAMLEPSPLAETRDTTDRIIGFTAEMLADQFGITIISM